MSKSTCKVVKVATIASCESTCKDYEKYCIATIAWTWFKLFHFINYQVVFNFRGGLVQVQND